MTKYCIKKYPMGSFKKQQSPGKYIDGYLYDNLKHLAKNIVNDMTFLSVIFSSTLEVGTGKSVFAQHMLEAYFDLVNKYHGTKLNVTGDNVIFRPKEIIDRAFKIPRYSGIIIDEWEDAHYWSELSMSLRQFFRKCRQLNLFIILIIPNFFQLPIHYAVSRSVFAVDVYFKGEFKRGNFSFYNFDRKKNLYLMGKRTQNYKAVKSNFYGQFTDGYAMGEEEYRRQKYEDMLNYDKDEAIKPLVKEAEVKQKYIMRAHPHLKKMGLTELQIAKMFGISERSLRVYKSKKTIDREDVQGLIGTTAELVIKPNYKDYKQQAKGKVLINT